MPPTVEAFLDWLGGPVVLRQPGRDRHRARGLSVLLHGNEPSSVRALHRWLRAAQVPAVDVVIFVGAVAGEALTLLRQAGCEALVDLHNNTGHNPPYGVGTVADATRLNLTSLFARRYVIYDLSLGALIEATADDFPSVAIECGRAGDPAADALATEGLARYLSTESFDVRHVAATHLDILASPVRVTVRPGLRLAFADRPRAGVDLTLRSDIDRHNFEPLLPGAPVGFLADDAPWPLEARGADGVDVSRDVFEVVGGSLRTRRGAVPIMMTTDAAVALADCLFYLVTPHEQIGGAGAL